MTTWPGVQLESDETRAPTGPFITLALFWIAGTALASLFGGRLFWLTGSLLLLIATLVWHFRGKHNVSILALCCALFMAGSWAVLRNDYVADDHISHHITDQSQLADVTGRIVSRVNVMSPQRGAFAKFSYEPPATMFSFAIDELVVNGVSQPSSGTLLAKIEQADHRLKEGDRVRLLGWLAPIDGPYNPGERDFRQVMRNRGIDGRITLRVRGNCSIVAPGDARSWLNSLRASISDAAANSLRIGMASDEHRLSFLETILLGRWGGDLGELRDSFRSVGLAHLLSISGAHLGILLFLVWLVVRWFVPHPTRATLIVLVVLLLYLLAVPLRVPIVRAGIMAGLICTGLLTGRRVRAVDMIAVSAVIVLIWRPADLFSAGFQLSFGIVAGLLIFVKPVSHWLWSAPLIVPPTDRSRVALVRWVYDYVAVNVVAFLIALPLVACHFQIISPLAVLLSLLAFPVVTVLLGLGYLKILVGLALPSGGSILAGPLLWISDTMTGLVEHATTWPAATVELARAPSLLWTFATLAVVIAMFRGWFVNRKWQLALAGTLCMVWLAAPTIPAAQHLADRWQAQPALKLNMFAVGDGSCFVVRVNPGRPDAHTFMFDCGSQAFLDTGKRTIGPALRTMSIGHIDTVFLSHADLDHFSGVLDVLEHVTVGRVIVPPQMLAEAAAEPSSTVGFLISELRVRGLFPIAGQRGWSEQWGDAKVALLWPPPDFEAARANDTSLVLSVRVADRRLLLNGDIARQAVPALLATGDNLNADITDLPHHGSFIDESPAWLEAVNPTTVLQSSGPTRLENDKWAEALRGDHLIRLVTARTGMVTVTVASDGTIDWASFRPPSE